MATISTGLLGEQLRLELDRLQLQSGSRTERMRQDILGFDENLPRILHIMRTDTNFGIFDFIPKEEIYKVDIGPIQEQMEYELFDDVQVSTDVPFVALNLNRKKVQGIKGRYLADKRYFKVYHAKDAPTTPTALLQEWSQHHQYAAPYTLLIKVLLRGADNEPMDPTDHMSYADIVYNFGDGLYLKLRKEQAVERKIERTIEVLRSHFKLFKLAVPVVNSISGSFVMDRILINPILFRALLVQPHQFGGTRPLLYHPFLWVNERDKALALRAQFILNFRLGDIQAKIIISEKKTKTNNLFYINGSPVKFKEGTLHNQITISDVKTREEAYLIRDVIASAFYLYGFPEITPGAQGQQSLSTRSMRWAEAFNILLSRYLLEGATFGPTMRISTADIKAIGKNIMQLRSCDPTFYGKIAAAKPISKNERQPVCIVSTSDPQWPQILLNTLLDIENDPPTARRQVVRYPFTISNPPSEEFARVPVTKVAPYFLMGRLGAPFFKPKITKDPQGGDGTYHPFLISCSTTEQIWIPVVANNDAVMAKYQVLANLATPFQVTMINKEKSGRANYKLSTVKVLNVGAQGQLPVQLVRVLKYSLLEGIQAIPTLELEFSRTGSPRSPDSLLHVLAAQSRAHPQLMSDYSVLLPDKQQELINRLRVQIADSVNWNLVRQEMFDMEPEQAKALFLDPKTPVDSRLFRSVLERYFNVFLCVIRFENMESKIEIPRHRYFHISREYPPDVQCLVVFKHQGSESSRVVNAQYELVSLAVRRVPTDPFILVPWELPTLKRLFDQANQTIDTSFITVRRPTENVFETGTVIKTNADLKPSLLKLFKPENLLFQYIDGAGKTRAVVHRYQSELFPSGDITIACEPLRPLELECFDDPKIMQELLRKGVDPGRFLRAEDFDKALEFVQSLGIKLENLAYRLEPEQLHLIQEVVEPEESDADQAEGGPKEEKETVDAALPTTTQKTKQIGVMERIMSLTAGPGLLSSSGMGIANFGQLPATTGPGAQFGPDVLTGLNTPLPVRSEVAAPTKKTALTRRRVTKSSGEDPMAIGIWFKIQDIQFYIATEPGTPPTKIFAVDNMAFFDVDPELIIFRQHDYYEKIANIMIQLFRNLYLYSRLDDPRTFTNLLLYINPNVIYDIRGARRRIPATRNFDEALVGYAELYPSFFQKISVPNSTAVTYKLIVESETSKKALLQQAKTLQKMKEDIVGSSGSLFAAGEGSDGLRRVNYQIAASYTNTAQPDHPVVGLDEKAIYLIPRMKEFMNRPDYLLEFYIYPSDFQIRGPNQHIFMSEDEFRQYQELLEMERPARVVNLPLDAKIQTTKAPLYYIGRDGSVYIFQNVIGGEARRARHVIVGWETERVNLGYFAEEWQGAVTDVPIINVRDLPALDPALHFALISYGRDLYAALLKLAGSVLF